MKMKIVYEKVVSIANFLDKTESENEDFASIDSNKNDLYSLYKITDGAGGSGVFSKEWSKYLSENIPQNPSDFADDKSKDWFNIISKGFYDDIIAKQDLSDLVLQRKVFKEGSYATLTVCWLDRQSNELFTSSIGDSCFFYFEKSNQKHSLKAISSLNQQNEIDEAPNLLNWNIELEKELPFDSFEIEHDFILILASDSLSKWILLNIAMLDFSILTETHFNTNFINSLNSEKYQSRKLNIKLGSNFKDLNDLFDYLKSVSKDNEIFKQSMKLLYENDELEIDDYSLIYVEGNVSE
jgi:hypothetical protein